MKDDILTVFSRALFWILLLSPLVCHGQDPLECKDDEVLRFCLKIGGEMIRFCSGGSTGIDTGDLLCILDPNNACDLYQRNDSCGQCDSRLEIVKFPKGTQYSDCNNTCFTKDTKFEMKVHDICGVCGGDNSTCVTFATSVDVKYIPHDKPATLALTGSGLLIDGVYVIVADMRGEQVETTSLASVVSSTSQKQITIQIGTLRAEGEFQIRAGQNVNAARLEPGPTLTVYLASDYSVTSMTPTELDLDPQVREVRVTLVVDIERGSETTLKEAFGEFRGLVDGFYCFLTESETATPSLDRRLVGVLNMENGELKCTVAIPEVSTETWVCASINGQHSVGCRELKIYHPAPTVVGKNFTLNVSASTMLELTFDQAVSPPSEIVTCDTLFEDPSSFGINPRCLMSNDMTKLTVYPGDNHTLSPDDIVELKSGFTSHVGLYAHETPVINLTVVLAEEVITGTMRLVVRGQAWPSFLTSHSPNPLTLAIEVLDAPEGKDPESIRWEVNGDPQDAWDDLQDVNLDVTSAGNYVITVTATDFLGEQTTLNHSFVKSAVDLPNVVFTPAILKPIDGGEYQIYPNTIFAINCRITYDVSIGIAAYNFTWTREEEPVAGQYYYRSTRTENTIMMCATSVTYRLTVSVVANPENNIVYPFVVRIVCRDPVARLKGNRIEDIAVDATATSIVVDAELSYDPDGGPLQYNWTCQQQTGGEDCLPILGIPATSSSGTVSFSPTKMTADQYYVFTVKVMVNKSDGVHESQAQKTIHALAGEALPIRMVTQRNKFRHDAPILMKAYIGSDTNATWSFVQKEGYDYADATHPMIGGPTQIVDGYTWYAIKPGNLIPGRKYIMKVRVTATSGTAMPAEREHELFIYQTLRNCYIQANALTELQETTVTLKGCLKDPSAGDLQTNCFIEGKQIPPGISGPFFVPVFEMRDVEMTNITCVVYDSVGHTMTVVSDELPVTLAANTDAEVTSLVEDLENNDRKFDAVDVLTSKITPDDDRTTSSPTETKVVDLVQTMIREELTSDEAARLLHSISKLRPHKVPQGRVRKLASQMESLLNNLCRQSLDDAHTSLTVQDSKTLLDQAGQLALSDKTTASTYLDIGERIACVRFKGLKNEEEETVELEGGGSVRYMYRTLDDQTFTNMNIVFPSIMQEVYRDVWQCGTSEMCHGVGIKVETYHKDPPHLQTGRSDTDCALYTVLDIYNPYNGSKIVVKDLNGRINMNFGNQCPRTTCWWYNFVVNRWDTSGVVAVPQPDGTINCETDHLSMFSVRSDPGFSTAVNIPFIISLPLGLIGFLVSIVIVIWALVRTLRAGKDMELMNDPASDPYSQPPAPFPSKSCD